MVKEVQGEIRMKGIYLDHSATTPVHPEVLEAMLPFYKERFGNASSTHAFGREAKRAVDEAREKVAMLIGGEPSEIIFTSGGTEADNFALRGVAYAYRERGNHIITSAIEHHAVLNTCWYLERKGFRVTFLPVDEYGIVNPDEVRKAINEQTILISIMHGNNEVGTIEPISEIGKVAKERGVFFHTDAVQTVGKIPVNVDDLHVDMLSLSGHKIYGPKGIGALYVRKGTSIVPLLYGGHHERGRRAGTENVPAVVGLGQACEIALKDLVWRVDYLKNLRDRLQAQIMKKISEVYLNGHPSRRLPHILNVSVKSVTSESIAEHLDKRGIAISPGAACTSNSVEISHVLAALGIPREIARGSLRFSLGQANKEEEIDYAADALAEVVEKLRVMAEYEKSLGLGRCV